MELASDKFGPFSDPYIIAEIGVAHEGSLDKALQLISLAAEGGAHGVKFQTYKADKIASKHSPAYWDLAMEPTTSQHDLFKKFDTFTEADYLACANFAKNLGVDFLSTPFDSQAVEFLDPLVPFHKIASADITTVPLLRQVGSKGKPVVLSTGAATIDEVGFAVNELEKNGCPQVVLLHCILNYPTDYKDANLLMIDGLYELFPNYSIGISDHAIADPDMLLLTAAYAKGAVVIEKHFTDNKERRGGDHKHSMDVDDLKKLAANLAFVRRALGAKSKCPIPSEEISRLNARRSIVLAEPISAGSRISDSSVTYKRPGDGISPTYWDDVIGRRIKKDLPADHKLTWDDLL